MASTAQINPSFEIMGADLVQKTDFLFAIQQVLRPNFLDGIAIRRMAEDETYRISYFETPKLEVIPITDCRPHQLEGTKAKVKLLQIKATAAIETYKHCDMLGIQGLALTVGEINTGTVNQYIGALISGINSQRVNNLYLQFASELWFGQTKPNSALTPVLCATAKSFQGLLPRIIEEDNGAGVMVVDNAWSSVGLTAGTAKAKFDQLIASNPIFRSVALGNGNGVSLRVHCTLAVWENLVASLLDTTVNTTNLLTNTISGGLNGVYMYNGIMIQAHPEWDILYNGAYPNIMLMTLESEMPLRMGLLNSSMSGAIINMFPRRYYNHDEKVDCIDYRYWYGLGTEIINGETAIRLAY